MHDFQFFGGGWMMIFWGLLLIVLIAVLVKAVLNSGNQNAVTQNTGETPMDILKRRYANGEIDKEEFEEKKKELLK